MAFASTRLFGQRAITSNSHRCVQNIGSKVSVPIMPTCDFIPDQYSGKMSYEEVCKVRQNRINPAVAAYYSKPLLIHQGHMQWLWDHEGKRYLDLLGGIVTISVGHCHPKVTAAAKSQMDRLWHTTNIYLHPTIHEYAQKLTDKFPSDLKVVYFVNSGSEANDLALMLARLYTGRWEIISFRNSYHGALSSLMGLTALSTWRYNIPTGFGLINTMNPDPYQGPWGGSNCRDSPVQTDRPCNCPPNTCCAEDEYVKQFQETLDYSCPKHGIAGFIAESIQGVGGTVQFPRRFLQRAYELVRSRGGVCIADEVQTGFGRTGTHFWGFEGHNVIPDIVTMAKGIGNGFPLAAVVTTPKIAAVLSKATHFNTFGGNPISCAVGHEVLNVLEEEQLQARCLELGNYFLTRLAELRARSPIIGDVRGKGLMLGVELVENKSTRKPLAASRVAKIWERMKELGVLVGKGGLHGNVFRYKPPMCITKEDIDFAIAVLDKTIHEENKGKD